MTVTEDQIRAGVERVKAARVAMGLTPLVSDERTLGIFYSVLATARMRKQRDQETRRSA
jgi:hypothetical protein